AGVVVNNGIVLVDYINQLRNRGMACRDAVVAAGCTRLRPVLLTAITTTLGLIPMATGISYDFHVMEISWVSESSQYWRSMAIAVIFGLMLATGLTLVVVPSLYSSLESITNFARTCWTRTHASYWRLYERIFLCLTSNFLVFCGIKTLKLSVVHAVAHVLRHLYPSRGY
ncbi:MAG: efflux RND transporter permease subunit, partial [Desulfobulbaceae bacterium]|nr:efflux RND transporter permease subunit [Desulfobulbaceae bacterium]